MATVTGYPFPIPADELGPLIVTLRTFQMDRQTQGGCDQCRESSVNPHILQWRLLCFYSMTTVSKYEAILLGMDWHLLCNDQFLLSIKRFYIVFSFLCSLPDRSITHAQIKHIWVYLVYIPLDMADTAATETPKLEDINIIICIRANFLGLYSIGNS